VTAVVFYPTVLLKFTVTVEKPKMSPAYCRKPLRRFDAVSSVIALKEVEDKLQWRGNLDHLAYTQAVLHRHLLRLVCDTAAVRQIKTLPG